VSSGDPTRLQVERVGRGPPVLFVHGSVVGAERTWRKQMALAERWTLILPSRPGFAGSPPLERGDFEAEAPLFAELLGDGAHLVGHSYGAIIALLAAAQRPDAVRSLTVSEPGALWVAAGDPEVDAMIENGNLLYRDPESIPPEVFLRLFRSGVGSANETPGRLPVWLARGVRLLKSERPPWEAEIPLGRLAGAGFRALVISGGHSRVFEKVCDVVAERLGAERAVISGRGHTIPSTGDPYNARLERHLLASERAFDPDL
jgi:pimeloyl-ACP methyl ester carboxylesterase